MTNNTCKVAFITGAGSGIGRASALALAKQGMKIALVDINATNLEEVKTNIIRNEGDAISLEADVTKEKDIQAAIKKTMEAWNSLDTVFISAGINGKVTSIEKMPIEEWNKTMDVNIKSTFLTIKHAIPAMKKNGGSIIITSSINGNRIFNNFGMSAYSTSKAAQVAFGKMAALELARYKIRVNTICPGAIDTNIDQNTFTNNKTLKEIAIPIEYPEGNQPLANKSGQPEQVADLVCFLSSKFSNHITGTEIYIDGAESLIF